LVRSSSSRPRRRCAQEPEDLGDFLERGKNAILATRFRDGRILLSPVWHAWRDGGFSVVIPEGDVKARHIARDPSVSIVVAEDAPPNRGIEVRGLAQRVPADIPALIHGMAVRYLGAELVTGFMTAYAEIPCICFRIQPGELRVWDFRDEEWTLGG
jgi:PPOX class probable F420-dependent enzyme